MFKTILAVSATALAVAGPAMAQDRLPAEFPPESYAGNQYVDSEGCAFIRAGIGGMTNWIPRMSRDREPLCGFQPTRIAGAAPPVLPDPAPAAAPERRAEAVAASAPTTRRAAPSSPRVVAPQPVRSEAPRLTFAAFCAGRSGPQPGYVSSRTGETIDCGGAVVAPGAPLRGAVTLAAVCADMAATGRRYVLRDTGAPVTCGPQSATAPAPGSRLAATRMPTAPAAPGAPVAAGQGPVALAVTSCAETGRSGLPRRCGPQAQSPSGIGNAARAATAPAAGHAAALAFLDPQADRLMRAAAAVTLPDPATPPAGYRRAFDDGRHNPLRGVRIVERAGAGQVRAPVTAAPVAVPTALVARVSTSSAPAQAATGRFVQLGTYAEPANAERAAARLRAMGLPVAQGHVSRNGTRMRVVATGPFADSATLGRALGAVRAAGYTDAFARR
ncbi:SPOR domain-containing protein [Limimaricola variabilis]